MSTALDTNYFIDSLKFNLNQYIIINANLNNTSQQSKFILDTGSPCTFNFKTCDENNLQTRKLFHFGNYKTNFGFTDARIGNMLFKKLQFLALDLELFNWQKVSGIIGVNAMKNSIWQINFNDTSIIVSDKITNFDNINDAYKTKFKPYSEQQTPVVKLVINDKDTIDAFIDTGNPGFINFSSDFNLENLKSNQPESIKSAYCDRNEQGKMLRTIYETNYIKCNSLKIGNFEFDSTVIEKHSWQKGKNLIGLKFLKNFIVTFDFINYNIYLKPNKKLKFPENSSTYGFECFREGDTLQVNFIYKGSMAEKLGMKCGDKIIKINSQNINNLEESLYKSITDDLPANKEITLTIKNKNENIVLKKSCIFNF